MIVWVKLQPSSQCLSSCTVTPSRRIMTFWAQSSSFWQVFVWRQGIKRYRMINRDHTHVLRDWAIRVKRIKMCNAPECCRFDQQVMVDGLLHCLSPCVRRAAPLKKVPRLHTLAATSHIRPLRHIFQLLLRLLLRCLVCWSCALSYIYDVEWGVVLCVCVWIKCNMLKNHVSLLKIEGFSSSPLLCNILWVPVSYARDPCSFYMDWNVPFFVKVTI